MSNGNEKLPPMRGTVSCCCPKSAVRKTPNKTSVLSRVSSVLSVFLVCSPGFRFEAGSLKIDVEVLTGLVCSGEALMNLPTPMQWRSQPQIFLKVEIGGGVPALKPTTSEAKKSRCTAENPFVGETHAAPAAPAVTHKHLLWLYMCSIY